MEELRLLALIKESLSISRRTVNFGFSIFHNEFMEACEIIERRYQQLRSEKRKQKRAEAQTKGGKDDKY